MKFQLCTALLQVMVVLEVAVPLLSQDAGYRPASLSLQPVLTPTDPKPVGQSPPSPGEPGPAPSPALEPGPSPKPSPSQPGPSQSDKRNVLSTKGKDILRKFDDYLFKNLEDTYFRLTYAFEDAAKKALDDCGCSIDSSNPLPSVPPPL